MRSTRIAFLSEHASPVALLGGQDAGGQNVYVDEITRALAAHGYAVDIFTRCGEPDAPDIVEWGPGVRVVNVKIGPARFLLKDDLWPLMPAFRDAIERFAVANHLRYDLIHGNFWMSGWVAAQLRKRLHVPAIQIFHAMGMTKRRHQGDADTSPAERIDVERSILRQIDRFIAQCPAERDEMVHAYGANPARIALIPSGVDIERFRPMDHAAARAELGLDPDEFVVVYVGRMVRRKDVRNVVRAVARLAEWTAADPALPRVRLVVVGGESGEPDPAITPEIGAVQRLAAELGVADRVVCVGARPSSELYKYYSAGDVAVTTPWYEPFGLTPLEAMACGRPVIGSAVGGIRFTIQDGITGFHVPPRDPEALADRLHWLMTDPGLAVQMGVAARERVERHFTWAQTAAKTVALYETALSDQRIEIPARPRSVAPALYGAAVGGISGTD